MATLRVSERVGDLGLYLKEQREQARLSLRELAKAAGVSNPYLSQIERGLRKPSAEVLQQIAKGLQISAEALYLRAGILEESRGLAVEVAIQTDPTLTQRQRRVMLDIYASFRAENGRLAPIPTDAPGEASSDALADALAGAVADAPADAPADAQADAQADAPAAGAWAETPAEAPPGAAGRPAGGRPRRAATRRRTPSGAATPKRSTRRSDAPPAATGNTHRTDGTAPTR